MRSFFCSSYAARGIRVFVAGSVGPDVGRLLGHTQPQTTARYAHLDDDCLREATNGFGRLVEGAGQGREAEVVQLMGREPKPL